mmetsp:Transcript_8125/g.25064  ORF Transcript_8125/g.25064 Transcript_8125/m.25064 type:complete len:219 (+) Transcript_8125:124-780(+)
MRDGVGRFPRLLREKVAWRAAEASRERQERQVGAERVPPLPGLEGGAEIELEGPAGRVLRGEVVVGVGDGVGVNGAGLVGLDAAVDDGEADVDVLGSQLAGEGLGERALGGLGRGEGGGEGFPAERGGRPRDDEEARASGLHFWADVLRGGEQAVKVRRDRLLELRKRRVVVGLPRPAPRVVDDRLDRPEISLDRRERRRQGLGRGHVRDVALAIRNR